MKIRIPEKSPESRNSGTGFIKSAFEELLPAKWQTQIVTQIIFLIGKDSVRKKNQN